LRLVGGLFEQVKILAKTLYLFDKKMDRATIIKDNGSIIVVLFEVLSS
jgi:hypothetical protein